AKCRMRYSPMSGAVAVERLASKSRASLASDFGAKATICSASCLVRGSLVQLSLSRKTPSLRADLVTLSKSCSAGNATEGFVLDPTRWSCWEKTGSARIAMLLRAGLRDPSWLRIVERADADGRLTIS